MSDFTFSTDQEQFLRDQEGPFTSEVCIGTLPLEPGQSLEFLYDFGDCWRFAVKLEGIDQDTKGPRAPKLLDKHGEAPQQYPDWDG